MSINGNLDEVVVIDTNELDWTPSPSGTVLRKRLHLVGPEESGQVTGLVQFQPGANFPAHEHPDGEEFFVLDGVFSDDSGDYGPGSYLLNPEGFAHGPSSEDGCTIFVKLRQYPGKDRPHITLDTNQMPWEGSGTIGVVQKTLYRDNDYPEAMTRNDGYFLDDDTGNAFISRAQGLGVNIICIHKGLPFPAMAKETIKYSQCRDVGPAAKNFPDMLVFVYGLYGLIFLCLSLAVSAWSRTPQRALVTLLAFWLVSSFLVPRLGTELSRQIHPIPNAIAFADSVEADMENGLDGTSQSQRLKELREKTLARYQVSEVDELPLNLEGLSFILMEQMGDAVFDKHFGGLQDSFGQQVGVLQGFALVSPLSALTQVSSNLAGTSLTDHYHFANAAEQFRRSFVRTMVPMTAVKILFVILFLLNNYRRRTASLRFFASL